MNDLATGSGSNAESLNDPRDQIIGNRVLVGAVCRATVAAKGSAVNAATACTTRITGTRIPLLHPANAHTGSDALSLARARDSSVRTANADTTIVALLAHIDCAVATQKRGGR